MEGIGSKILKKLQYLNTFYHINIDATLIYLPINKVDYILCRLEVVSTLKFPQYFFSTKLKNIVTN